MKLCELGSQTEKKLSIQTKISCTNGRESYTKPFLVQYGSVADLTAGGRGSGGDVAHKRPPT